MPKILLIANTDWFLYNFRLGLARFLRTLEYEVVLVSPPGPYTAGFEADGFRWIRWNVSRKQVNPFDEVDALLSLLRIYHKEAPDIVHHHTIKPVIYGSIAARLAKTERIINSITGRGYVFQSEKIKARFLKNIVVFLYRLVLNYPNSVIIFENQFDREHFISAGYVPAGRTHLIQGVGVDPDRFSPGPEPENPPLVLMCGRMLWDKGVGTFVDAARIVKSKMDARFVLVGEPDPGNPEPIPEDVLRGWEDEEVVEWWGWQSDMASIYSQAHMVVLPTFYGEGVPTVLIEAAASGKPLVASDIPGCQAVVQNEVNGYLISPGQSEKFASAIEKLIASPELRRRMGENSRKLFLENFTLAQINQATFQVYQQPV
jgi:glycosyltransferase involved in cell wall biosynthesis